MTTRLHRVRWEDEAACRDVDDPEIFFELENAVEEHHVADPVRIARALALCHTCPIAERCFKEGVFTRSLGIWGGTTAEERGLRFRAYTT